MEQQHLPSPRSAVLLIALVAALAIAPVAPEAGNILYLVAASIGLLLVRPIDFTTFLRPVVWMPLFGVVLIAVAYGLASGSAAGALAGITLFAPFLAIGPLLALPRAQSWPEPSLLALLSMIGIMGAAAVVVGEVVDTNTYRAGASVANPIHFADVALAAGFLATMGVVYWKGTARYLFLLGPVFAGVAVLLSGTRGAVLALAAMAAIGIVLMLVFRQVTRRVALFSGVLLLLGLGAALAVGVTQTSGVQRVMIDLQSVLQGGLPTDDSTTLRLQMYEGGWRAFLDSPWIGHGPFAYVEAAAARVEVPLLPLPHLHNDLADFAASGGILGLLAYALFILGPLVEALRAPSIHGPGLVIVASVLVAGYVIMGLTNAMFGILTITMFFSAISVVVALAARPMPVAPAQAGPVAT